MMSNAYTPSSCRTSSSSSRAVAAGVAFVALLSGAAARALPEDADQPIHIRADNVEYDQNGNRVIYRGSVQVDQGTLRVTAETLTIDLQDGKKVLRITAEDTPAHYQQQIEEGKELVRAQALTIIYHTQDERVDLKGDANLEQEGSTLEGDLIVYDIVAGRVDATAEREEPVRMVLQPAVTKSASPKSGTADEPE
jgi:lipopolysaccharide export system protein LptA